MSEPSHEPFDGLASLYALGALSARERAEFEEHLELCRACVDEVMATLPVTHKLAAAAPKRDAPPSLRTRVVTAVTGAAPVTAVVDRALGTEPPPAKASGARPRGGVGRALFGLAAAACLVAAAGLGWYAAQQVNLARSLQENLDAANQRATLAELQAQTAQQVAEEARQRAVILAASDLLQIRLDGQPVAPDASARAFWSPTTGVIFTAAGLPALPAGRVYQLWFVPGVNPVSAGLLTVDGAGRVSATIATPEEVTGPAPMAVTLEPEGGVESPTGEVYLLGRPAA